MLSQVATCEMSFPFQLNVFPMTGYYSINSNCFQNLYRKFFIPPECNICTYIISNQASLRFFILRPRNSSLCLFEVFRFILKLEYGVAGVEVRGVARSGLMYRCNRSEKEIGNECAPSHIAPPLAPHIDFPASRPDEKKEETVRLTYCRCYAAFITSTWRSWIPRRLKSCSLLSSPDLFRRLSPTAAYVPSSARNDTICHSRRTV